MRKLLMAIVAVALFAGMAMAQLDVTGTVVINAPVGGLFTMALSGGPINYVGLVPGVTDNTKSVGITVRSNYKNADWVLQVHQNQLLTDGTITESIPSTSFTHSTTGAGVGLYADAAPTQFVTGTAATFYTCVPATEGKTTGLGLTFTQALQLSIPVDQAAGAYTNTLTYTLTVNP